MKIFFSPNEINNPPTIMDVGCGFQLITFKNKLNINEVRNVFGALTSTYFINSFISYVDFYIKVKSMVTVDDDFINNQYISIGKIFGGNHFIEYGQLQKSNNHYILIHSGDNGSFLHNNKQNTIEKAVKYSYWFSRFNRDLICNYIEKYFSIQIISKVDQIHNLYENGCISGFSRIDNKRGNIFANGPWGKSFIIRPKNKNKYRYVRHGSVEKKIFVFTKDKNYNRKFKYENLVKNSDCEILYILKPLEIGRPINDH